MENFYLDTQLADARKAAYEVTKAVLPDMVKQNYGRIIYVATGSAKYPSPPGAIAFETAKAGLVTFAEEKGLQQI
jgi:3-oxoacyl-[acyl-carrier protein] reductase